MKEHSPGGTNPQPVTSAGELPAGVVFTKDKKFLIRPSMSDFKVGAMTVTYNVVTPELDAAASPVYVLAVKYIMPTMPTMPVTPPDIKQVGPGKTQVTYDINMGGAWRIDITVMKDGAAADTYSYSFDVPE